MQVLATMITPAMPTNYVVASDDIAFQVKNATAVSMSMTNPVTVALVSGLLPWKAAKTRLRMV